MRRAMSWVVRVAWLACLALPLLSASAEVYPSKPIHLVVPYPPAGGIDPAARVFALALSAKLKQSIVIDNVGGASGQIGTQQVARSAPDGYVLLFASVGPNSILPAAKPDLPYKESDLTPISLVGRAPYVLVVNPAVPAHDAKELLALGRAHPDQLGSFASSGTLGGPHLAGEWLKVLTGLKMTHIPYRGDGPAVTAVIAGEVPMMFGSAPSVMPHVKSGRLRVIAVTGNRRSAAFPGVPSLSETVPGHDVSQWYGLMAPAGTPQPVLDRLLQATRQVMAETKMKADYLSMGVDPIGSGPDEFKTFIDSETAKWHTLIEQANIPVE